MNVLDVYIGTTWLAEIACHMVYGHNAEEWQKQNIMERAPMLEFFGNAVKLAERQSPRVIKTHLTNDLLPIKVNNSKAKVIIYLQLQLKITIKSL